MLPRIICYFSKGTTWKWNKFINQFLQWSVGKIDFLVRRFCCVSVTKHRWGCPSNTEGHLTLPLSQIPFFILEVLEFCLLLTPSCPSCSFPSCINYLCWYHFLHNVRPLKVYLAFINVCLTYVGTCECATEEDVGSLGGRVTGGCNLLRMGARSWNCSSARIIHALNCWAIF